MYKKLAVWYNRFGIVLCEMLDIFVQACGDFSAEKLDILVQTCGIFLHENLNVLVHVSWIFFLKSQAFWYMRVGFFCCMKR